MISAGNRRNLPDCELNSRNRFDSSCGLGGPDIAATAVKMPSNTLGHLAAAIERPPVSDCFSCVATKPGFSGTVPLLIIDDLGMRKLPITS
jgi:hypothetical protein